MDLGDVEEGSPADTKKPAEVRSKFGDVIAALHKKLSQLADKLETVPLSNKKLRRRWQGKLNRAKVEMSQAIRAAALAASRTGSSSRKEIEHAVEQLAHLEQELRKLEGRSSQAAQAEVRELKRDIRKRETDAPAPLDRSEAHACR